MITESPTSLLPLSRRQWAFLLLLAAINFAHVLDFIIMMPLATYFEASFGVTTTMFGALVSSYGFAAAIAGVALAPVLDRFDRKNTLLVVFAGFTVGTTACAVAPNYWMLMTARFTTGAFGGILGSSVLAIVGDAFPAARRATAMGAVMSAFSVASILGLPAGLYLAQASSHGWRTPFAIIAILSAGLLLLSYRVMPSVTGHLSSRERPSLATVLLKPAHVRAYMLSMALIMSSFMVLPFMAAFLEKNVGFSKAQVPYVYLCGGICTLLSTNVVGRISDRLPRLHVFRILAFLTLIPMIGVTLLPRGTSLWFTLTITTILMVLASGRMVPAVTMITSSAEPRYRGSFLSINASVQQAGAGLAPLLAGLILTEDNETLVHYNVSSIVGAGFGLASIVLAGYLRPAPIASEETVPDIQVALPVLQESV